MDVQRSLKRADLPNLGGKIQALSKAMQPAACPNRSGVCIMLQEAAAQPGLIDKYLLQHAGFKLRSSKSVLPDIILAQGGRTAAFLLISTVAVLAPNNSPLWVERWGYGVYSLLCAELRWPPQMHKCGAGLTS